MMKSMVMENKLGRLAEDMKELGLKVKCMEMVNSHGKMENYM